MNEIKVSVNFKTGKCIAYGYDPVDNDYNASKLVFNFDEEYDGRKIVEIRPEDSSSKEATFASEIINNEVILAKEVADEYHSIFTTSGRHIIEVHLYSNGSKVTAICEKPFYVREEQINIGDEQATVYLPVFEQMIQELNTGLDNLSSGLNSLNNAITETNNLDLDVSKTDKEATVTIRKKDNTTKSITLSDGTSLMFHWRGTYLGIKTDKDDEYTYVNLQGIQGEKGETGAPFRIKKTYANIQLMIADYDNMQVDDHVMISGNVEQEDNAKLFTKTETEDPIYRWQYLGDFSGATGIQGETGLTPNIQIGSVVSGDSPSVTRTGTNENPILNFVLQKGEKGDTGNTGATGPTGNGIVSIIKTSTEGLVDTYTITYTNGTTTTFQITNGEDGEVTQSQLDEVQEEVDDLRRNQKQDTASGTNIYVDDAFDTKIMESRMSKESTQETTEGKNLLSIEDNTRVISGLNITYKQGKIILSGTLTVESRLYVGGSFNNTSTLFTLPAGTYTLQNVRLENYDGTNRVTKNHTFTIEDSFNVTGVVVGNSGTYVSGTYNEILYAQLEQGSSATNWEKYTGGQASPNPLFPSDVKTVKGYRNEFSTSVVQGTIDTNSVAASTTRLRTVDFIKVNPNTTYRLIFESLTNVNSYNVSYFSTNSFPRSSSSNWVTAPTFTTPAICNYIMVTFRKSDNSEVNVNDISKIMLTEGTEALPYVPYGNNYVYTKVIGKNLLSGMELGEINSQTGAEVSATTVLRSKNYIKYELNKTYYAYLSNGNNAPSLALRFYNKDKEYIGYSSINYSGSNFNITETTSIKDKTPAYFRLRCSSTSYDYENLNIMITTTNNSSYEPYKESIVTIPLNGNEIARIGDYKDELIVDSKGKCWLNKKIGKVVLDGSENWTYYSPALVFFTDEYNSLFNTNVSHSANNILSNYYKAGSYNTDNNVISINSIGRIHIRNDDITTVNDFKNWLSTHNTLVYSDVETPELIDLNYTVDIRLFNGVNNISNSDDMDMEIKYVQDINQIINNITNAMLEIGGN